MKVCFQIQIYCFVFLMEITDQIPKYIQYIQSLLSVFKRVLIKGDLKTIPHHNEEIKFVDILLKHYYYAYQKAERKNPFIQRHKVIRGIDILLQNFKQMIEDEIEREYENTKIGKLSDVIDTTKIHTYGDFITQIIEHIKKELEENRYKIINSIFIKAKSIGLKQYKCDCLVNLIVSILDTFKYFNPDSEIGFYSLLFGFL